MMSCRKLIAVAGCILATLFFSNPVKATVTSGAGGSGVTVGSSSIPGFTLIDYSDTYTGTADGGIVGRTTNGAFPVNVPGTNVEFNAVNAPSQAWTNFKWSLNTDANVFATATSPYPGTSGAGSDLGFTQTGGGGLDFGIEYGLRDRYIVQFDAVQSSDRVNITSSSGRNSIAAVGGLSVFFRSSGAATEIGIFNGAVETSTGFSSGITAGTWNNYAVDFDQASNAVSIYVNEALLGAVDLNTFGGGAYAGGFTNAAISVGVSGADRQWTDNFQVGGPTALPVPPAPHPDPGNIASPPTGLISFWDFDEASGPVANTLLNFAYDRVSSNDGSFGVTAGRTTGLVGLGAASFPGTVGNTVNVGPGVGNNFSMSTGITVEAVFQTDWAGNTFSEIFRKEDIGGSRILFSFQVGNILSFGLKVNGVYSELDVVLDGLDGRPLLADLNNGSTHHVAATYDSTTGEKALWVDGNMIGSVNLGAGNLVTSGGGAPGHIGSTNGNEPFSGVLDEVAIWNRSLTDAEVALHSSNIQQGQNYFVPEPDSIVLVILGFAAIGLMIFQQRKKMVLAK